MSATRGSGQLDRHAPEPDQAGDEGDPQPREDAVLEAHLDAIALELEAVYEKARADRAFQQAIEARRAMSADSADAASGRGDVVARFERALAQHDQESRRERDEQGCKRLMADLRAMDSEEIVSRRAKKAPNVAAALRSTFRFWDKYLPQYVLGEISNEVGFLAERHLAQFAWLFVVDSDSLVDLTTNGFVKTNGRRIAIDGPGIVPLVARTRQPYCAGEVANGGDPYYVPFREESRSEQAVPLVFQGRLLGVLNQESMFPGAFSPASAKALEQDAIRLVRQLLALEAHGKGTCWNPDRHGWDFTYILNMAIHQLKQGMDWAGEAVHLTVWYADPLDETVFALASTGYGAVFLKDRVIALRDSFTGAMALGPEDTVDECLVGDPRLKRAEVDRSMGLRKVRAVTVCSCSRPTTDFQPGIVLSFYVFDDEAISALPDEAQLREIAQLLREQIDAYVELRPRLAAAGMEQALMECADTDDQLRIAAKLAASVLDADALTIFARPRGGSRELHVAACTVPVEVSSCNSPMAIPPSWGHGLNGSGYEVGDGTLTGALAANPGFSVRLNSPRSVSKLPANWPRRPSYKVKEYLPKTVGAYRRCLGIGISGHSDKAAALGVFRAIRPFDSKPYTLWELETLIAMARSCIDALRSWRDWIDYACAVRVDDARLGDRRLEQPIPRASTRPIRVLAHEVLVDVYEETKRRLGDCVLETAVLVERPHNAVEPMHILAYHWELGPTPPNSSDTLSFQRPRVPGETWCELLERGEITTFTSPASEVEVAIRSGVRVPFWTWCGRHPQRGMLVVDLTQAVELGTDLIAELHVAARKLGAILALAGTSVMHSELLSVTDPRKFLHELCATLDAVGAHLRLSPKEGTPLECSIGNPLPREFMTSEEEWLVPTIEPSSGRVREFDHDEAISWGVREGFTATTQVLCIPLRLGTVPVGDVVVAWEDTPPDDPGDSAYLDDATRRSLRIRGVLAMWSLWTWNWRDQQLLRVGFRREWGENPSRWTTSVRGMPMAEDTPIPLSMNS